MDEAAAPEGAIPKDRDATESSGGWGHYRRSPVRSDRIDAAFPQTQPSLHGVRVSPDLYPTRAKDACSVGGDSRRRFPRMSRRLLTLRQIGDGSRLLQKPQPNRRRESPPTKTSAKSATGVASYKNLSSWPCRVYLNCEAQSAGRSRGYTSARATSTESEPQAVSKGMWIGVTPGGKQMS